MDTTNTEDQIEQTTSHKIKVTHREQLYSYSNVISELSKLLSDRLRKDEAIKDQFVLVALADGIKLAADNIDDLVCDLIDPSEQIEAQ